MRAAGADWAVPAACVRHLLRQPVMAAGQVATSRGGVPVLSPLVPGAGTNPAGAAVVMEIGGQLSALLVDAIGEVVDVQETDVGGSRSPRVRAMYPRTWGVWRGRARPVFLLDPEELAAG